MILKIKKGEREQLTLSTNNAFGGNAWDKGRSILLRIAPLITFLIVFIWLFWLIGYRLILISNDEGIYLDAARRVAEGQFPYRDFFYLSGPGTPWIMGFFMKIFGINLPVARLMLVFDVSLMAAIIFSMTKKLGAHIYAAALAVFLFVAFSTAQPMVILPNHRWDSSAMALVAIFLTLYCRENPGFLKAFGAGFSVVAAAWITPSMGILIVVLLLWFIFNKYLRAQISAFLVGSITIFTIGIYILYTENALLPMFHQLVWIFQNYSGANRMPYGQVIGGYSSLFQGTSGMSFFIMLCAAFIISIPAWLPPSVTAGWIIQIRKIWSSSDSKRFEIIFLLSSGWTVNFAQAPRMDLVHLMYVSPIFFVLAITLITKFINSSLRTPLIIILLFSGGLMFHHALETRLSEVKIETHIGTAYASKDEAGWLADFEKYVKREDTIFAYPYMPIFYFVLDAHNPTKYSFLQPGMFPESDEANALSDLRKNPPEWIIYLNITPKAYLRIWPSSNRSSLRMKSLEEFISDNYAYYVKIGPYRLMHHH